MRTTSMAVAAMLALPLLAAAPAARAGTVTQTITGLSQSEGDFTPFNISALPFNPATGVLQSVSVELIGSYTPETANDLGPFPATTALTTSLFLFATNGGATSTFTLGTQSGVPVTVAGGQGAGLATGTATAVDQVAGFSDLAAFETASAGSQVLIEYGFRTSNTLSGAGGASDLTTFSGRAILTYTYATAVPEPASLALLAAGALGTGLLGMTGLRRRRRA